MKWKNFFLDYEDIIALCGKVMVTRGAVQEFTNLVISRHEPESSRKFVEVLVEFLDEKGHKTEKVFGGLKVRVNPAVLIGN